MSIENDGKRLGLGNESTFLRSKTNAGNGLGLKLIDYRVDLLGGKWSIQNHEVNPGVILKVSAPINGDIN